MSRCARLQRIEHNHEEMLRAEKQQYLNIEHTNIEVERITLMRLNNTSNVKKANEEK